MVLTAEQFKTKKEIEKYWKDREGREITAKAEQLKTKREIKKYWKDREKDKLAEKWEVLVEKLLNESFKNICCDLQINQTFGIRVTIPEGYEMNHREIRQAVITTLSNKGYTIISCQKHPPLLVNIIKHMILTIPEL